MRIPIKNIQYCHTSFNYADIYGDWANPALQGKSHKGIDIAPNNGWKAKVFGLIAPENGELQYADWKDGYGNVIYLKSDLNKGVVHVLAHLSKIAVKTGNSVYEGRWLGNMGNTGWSTAKHLHAEVRVYNLDTLKFLIKKIGNDKLNPIKYNNYWLVSPYAYYKGGC